MIDTRELQAEICQVKAFALEARKWADAVAERLQKILNTMNEMDLDSRTQIFTEGEKKDALPE